MTLSDLFESIAQNPLPLFLFFIALPLIAWTLGGLATGSRAVESWGMVFAVLVYAACIPGIFAVTLNVYLFLFERQSIWHANLLLQVVPVISMVITLLLIRKKIPFDLIPGFGKLSGFMTLIAALIGIMWFLDRLRLIAFTYVPFSALLIGFVLMLVLIRFAWSKLF
ncbi:hypothetical protein [Arundinibacter roseus]|uniref:Uncharacterized protein n=1 Tax=Arundinibacter roseus TaxID=2070510 RepID=A0A4R4K9T4_9BACT|nr:hypothetical protein [Arundinibacter roseus]TDB64607.1 hypothetical protein EZE20_13125 [Arundinibacter roseus]